MSEVDYIRDLVVLFDASVTAVEQEMSLADFESLCRRGRNLSSRSGETVSAAYVTVAPGLKVAGIAFFLFHVDPAGVVSEPFNTPLPYLVENAGIRSDLGLGAIKVASRAQCPVAWLALKLWEPSVNPDGPARVIQRAVLLNRLGLRSAAPAGGETETGADDRAAGPETRVAPATIAPEPRTATAALPRAAARQEPSGAEQGYLEQIRKFRAEVSELKAALRSERELNRRLQALLRGQI